MDDYFCLSQVVHVSGHIHVSTQSKTTLIDLVLTSAPSQMTCCDIISPLANPDNKGIKLNINWKGKYKTSTYKRTIWRYAYADFNKANDIILETDWDTILWGSDVEEAWSCCHKTFLSIMETCIPKRIIPSNKSSLVKQTFNTSYEKKCLVKKAKLSKNPLIILKYKNSRNNIVSQLRLAKKGSFKT